MVSTSMRLVFRLPPRARHHSSTFDRGRRTAVLLGLALSCATVVAPSSAQTQEYCDPCVVQLAEDTLSATVTLDGWAVPSGDLNQIGVSIDGQHGSFDPSTETYTPAPSFWQIGMDSVTVIVDTHSDLREGAKTLIFTDMDRLIVEEQGIDFSGLGALSELGHWRPAGGVNESEIGPDQELINGRLRVVTVPGNDNGIVLDSPYENEAPHQQVAGSTPIPQQEPPISGVPLPNFYTDIFRINSMIRVQLQSTLEAGTFRARVRAAFMHDYFDCGGDACATDWIDLPNPTDHYLDVMASPHILGLPDGHPSANKWSLRLRVRNFNNAAVDHRVEHLVPIDPTESLPSNQTTEVGAFDTQALDAFDQPRAPLPGESLRLSTDMFHYYSANILEPADMMYADFDNSMIVAQPVGTESELNFEGPIGQEPTVGIRHQSLNFDRRQVVDLYDLIPLAYPGAGLPNHSPTDPRAMMAGYFPDNAGLVNLSFELDSNADIAKGTYVTVAEIGRSEATSNVGPLRIFMLVANNNVRYFRARLWQNPPLQLVQTDWVPADSRLVRLGLQLRLADEGESNGSLQLMVNDEVREVTGLENDRLGVEWIGVGALTVSYANQLPFDDMFLRFDDVLWSYR